MAGEIQVNTERRTQSIVGINSVYADRSGATDTLLKCNAIEIRPNGFGVFTLVATYSIPDSGDRHVGKNSEDDDDPLSAPAEYLYEPSYVSLASDRDRDGNAVVTSSREGFDPPLQKEVCEITLTISKNYPFFDPRRAAAYMNTVNNDTFHGWAAQEVRCLYIKPATVITAVSTFVKVDHVFRIRPYDEWGSNPHMWWPKDQGYKAYSADANPAGYYELFQKNPDDPADFTVRPTNPVPLNGYGKPVFSENYMLKKGTMSNTTAPTGVVTLDVASTGITFLLYKPYREVAFAGLGI
jgi:hypothetical protein